MDNQPVYGLDDTTAETEQQPAMQESCEEDGLRTENSDGSVTLQLKYPVERTLKQGNQERTEVIDQLTIRRANGADVRMVIRFQNDEEKLVVMLFKNLTGQHETIFDRMDAVDVLRFSQEVEDFLPQRQAIGKK